MNILYCGDSRIVDGVLMSVLSLIDHTNVPLHIFLLTADGDGRWSVLPESFARYLEEVIQDSNAERTVTRIDITELFRQEQPTANFGTRFTPCCMLRLFADRIPGLPDRLLYLDNDVLCRGDLSTLWQLDMAGQELAGVPDYYGRWVYRRRPFHWDYLNSGVLLLNLPMIRETGLFRRCRRRCRERRMLLPDQSALNALVRYRVLLPRRYNEQRKLKPDTVLQHFTTEFRLFPYLRTVTAKPWDIERIHRVFGIREYDELWERYDRLMREYSHLIKECQL